MTLAQMACAVLNTVDGFKKKVLTRNFAAQWFAHRYADQPI